MTSRRAASNAGTAGRLAVLAAVCLSTTAAADVDLKPDWMKTDPAAKVVELKIFGAMDHENGTMNFNGYGNGEMTITVPFGWTVKVEFENKAYAALPHSLAIVKPNVDRNAVVIQAAFEGAFTKSLLAGMAADETDSFEFVANQAGRFLLYCPVPSHGKQGMWTHFVVSKSAKLPSATARKRKKSE